MCVDNFERWTSITIDVPVGRDDPLLDDIAVSAMDLAAARGMDAHVISESWTGSIEDQPRKH